MEPASLRDPALALELAEEACRQERENNGRQLWMYLDTLALAQFETGDAEQAITTQRQVLEMLPATAERFRGELEKHLARYEANGD